MHRVWRRDRFGRQVRNWVAACIAVLVAVAPLTDRELVRDISGPLSVHDSTLHVDSRANEPITTTRLNQSTILGLAFRLMTGESKPGLPPNELPLLVAHLVRQSLLALERDSTSNGLPTNVLSRSAVGTARTPTGPPT
jgi:hypothetical protein